jgi:hypothetical protein
MNSGWLLHRVENFAQGMGVCNERDAFSMPEAEQKKEPEKELPEEPLLDEADTLDGNPRVKRA